MLIGHLKASYEIPGSDLTLARTMDNGVKVRGFITATNLSVVNIFGAPANLYSGVEITLSFGDRSNLPPGSAPRRLAAGQSLDNLLPLHDLTEPFSEC